MSIHVVVDIHPKTFKNSQDAGLPDSKCSLPEQGPCGYHYLWVYLVWFPDWQVGNPTRVSPTGQDDPIMMDKIVSDIRSSKRPFIDPDIHWLFFKGYPSMLTHWHPSLSNVLFDIYRRFLSAIQNLLIILFSLASVVISNVFKWQTDQRESYSTVIKSRVKFWYFICSNDSIGCIYKRLSAFEAAPILLKAMGLVAKCRLGLNLMGFQSLSQREGGGRD